MYYNKKRKAIIARYVKAPIDDIKIRVPRNQREKLKAIVAKMGMSMNQSLKKLADLLEVVYSVAEARGFTVDELESVGKRQNSVADSRRNCS